MSRTVALSAAAAKRLLHELAALHKDSRRDEHIVELAPVDEDAEDLSAWPVSYTHLTLTTKRIV